MSMIDGKMCGLVIALGGAFFHLCTVQNNIDCGHAPTDSLAVDIEKIIDDYDDRKRLTQMPNLSVYPTIRRAKLSNDITKIVFLIAFVFILQFWEHFQCI